MNIYTLLNRISILKSKTLGYQTDLANLTTASKTNLVSAINSIMDGSSIFSAALKYQGDFSVQFDGNPLSIPSTQYVKDKIATSITTHGLAFRSITPFKIHFGVNYIASGLGAGSPQPNWFDVGPMHGESLLNVDDHKIYVYDTTGTWQALIDLGSLNFSDNGLVSIACFGGQDAASNPNVVGERTNYFKMFNPTTGQFETDVTINPKVTYINDPKMYDYVAHYFGANPELDAGQYALPGTGNINDIELDPHHEAIYHYDTTASKFVEFISTQDYLFWSLIGVTQGSSDLGTFTGTTIPDNTDIKTALQSLETAVENAQGSASSSVQYSDFTDTSTIDFTATQGDIHADIVAGSITDAHISPTANISADKLVDGTTNAIITLAQESNFETAYTHSQITGSNPHLTTLEQVRAQDNVLQGEINMNNFRIINLATPVDGGDAVNKSYVDSVSAGLDPKESVVAATTGNLDATYDSVAMTLTMNAVGALTIDGVALTAGDRVLVKDQTDATQNGIYVVTSAGDGTTAAVLTRASDFDGTPSEEVSGGNYTFVETGNTYAGAGFAVLGQGILTIDTDPINWTQFSGAGQIVAGVGLTKNGNILSVLFGAGITELPTGEVGLDIQPNSGLFMTEDGTTSSTTAAAKLAIDPSIAGTALSFTTGVMSVKYDNITIGVNNNNELEVKANSIGSNELKLGNNAGDVNGSVIPFDKTGTFLSSTDVTAAIKEVFDRLFDSYAQYVSKTFDADGFLTKEMVYTSNVGNLLYTVEYTYEVVNEIKRESQVVKKIYAGDGLDEANSTLLKTITDVFTYDANGNNTEITRTVV